MIFLFVYHMAVQIAPWPEISDEKFFGCSHNGIVVGYKVEKRDYPLDDRIMYKVEFECKDRDRALYFDYTEISPK